MTETSLRDVRSFAGTLQAHSQFDVAPQIAGRLERLTVNIGDRVTRGQVVAQLNDDEFVQQAGQARAELGVARATLSEARSLLDVKRRQAERAEKLFVQHIGSEADLETAQAEAAAQQARLQVAQAQVTQREAALKAAEVRLAYTVIRAAWSDDAGPRVVAERYVNEGEMLAANKPILSVVETRRLTAVVQAAERDYPHLAVGQPATIMADAYSSRRVPGRVARIAPVFRETSRQARVEIEVANEEEALQPGMFARVEIEVGRAEHATVVPLEAIVTRAGETGVFLAEPTHQARFVPVRTGIIQGALVQIVTPPLSGEVVTLGNHLLSDGVPIAPVDSHGAPQSRPALEGPRPDRKGAS
ncbi:MAG: efflux RND transporter periplasmic adaptor subunit [Candidatus Lambdaproteobacteria bacterium]|nr:efflux RND transporter periplasmic adaptor subunit [Candidatus Lambdaproteobacteria bacterium]